MSGDTQQDISLSLGKSVIGDVDLDGDVDYDDYELLLLNIKCNKQLSDRQMINADINGDGAVDAIDALYLDLYLSGAVQLPRSEEHTSELQSRI